MVGKPLSQSNADQRRFIDRARECRAVVQAVEAGEPVLLLGERGSGRTSLLNRVARQLARALHARATIMLSGEVAQDPAQFLGVLIARLYRLTAGAPRTGWLAELQALSMPDGPFGQVAKPAILMELLDLLADRLAEMDSPVCVLIDEMSPSVAHGLFGTLRNELWGLDGIGWVLAGDLGARSLYLEPPADAFFARVIEIPRLNDADAAKLLRAHLPDLDKASIERAVAAGGGNPRRLLRAANDVLSGVDPAVNEASEASAAAAALAGPLAGRLIDYAATHGPTSASDQRMLRAVGMSRQRASQLLRSLEEAGLVETVPAETNSQPGRPQRRFAVRKTA